MALLLDLAHGLRHTVPISRWTPLLVLVGAAICLTNWRWVALRTGWRPLPTLGAGLALAGALAMTVSPRGWQGNHRTLAQCVPTDWPSLADPARGLGGDLESLLNITLLAPLGFALVLATRRIAWPAVFVMVLPAVIELSQIAIRGRQCSPADWMANALGGLVGAAAAIAVEHCWQRRPGNRHRSRTADGQPPTQPPALTSS